MTLAEIRSAEHLTWSTELKTSLRTAADELEDAIVKFCKEQTDDTLRFLNGKWARAVKVLDQYNARRVVN